MRTIEQTTRYKKDIKREVKGQYRNALENELVQIISALANDQVLPEKNRDHALVGEWQGYRNCHIKPDLVLIYAKPDNTTLQLIRLGSHSELGL